MMHKCVDTAKKESGVVNAGWKQEQPLQELQEQKGVREALPYGKKTFILLFVHSLNKYVLSTNQVSDKSKKMKALAYKKCSGERNVFGGDQEEDTLLCLGEHCVFTTARWMRSFLGRQ